MSRLAANGESSERQRNARALADPALDDHVGGYYCSTAVLYAARSREHAESMHRARMHRLLHVRRAHAIANPPPPERDCPWCPECVMPFGSTDLETELGAEANVLMCKGCGEAWTCTPAEYAQALRADAAYEAIRALEERDRPTLDRMPASVLATNQRMLARVPEAPAVREQLDMFGGTS